MKVTSVGWVMDKDTSKRRVHLELAAPGVLRLTVEVYGQQASVLELDAEGIAALHQYVVQAYAWSLAQECGAPIEEGH